MWRAIVEIIYTSPSILERTISTEDDYRRLHFALYRCSPDDICGINERRKELSIKYPSKTIPCGRYFILIGVAAAEALSAFYYSMHLAETLPEYLRSYYLERFEKIQEMHQRSQSLPTPVDITEGQFGTDKKMGTSKNLWPGAA
jgi:hypothetical protein